MFYSERYTVTSEFLLCNTRKNIHRWTHTHTHMKCYPKFREFDGKRIVAFTMFGIWRDLTKSVFYSVLESC